MELDEKAQYSPMLSMLSIPLLIHVLEAGSARYQNYTDTKKSKFVGFKTVVGAEETGN